MSEVEKSGVFVLTFTQDTSLDADQGYDASIPVVSTKELDVCMYRGSCHLTTNQIAEP